jgi:putative ABC transport system permease protein
MISRAPAGTELASVLPMLRDLRFALRGLVRAPGFTLVAIVTLALGIGANTAIFSVVDSVLLRPLPYPRAERLMSVSSTIDPASGKISPASWPDFLDLRARSRAFGELAALHDDAFVLTGAGPPQHLDGVAATANVFAVLGVAPALGRGFAPGEDAPGAPRVAVLSWRAWHTHFGGNAAIVGRTASIDGIPTTIIGVMPRDLRFPLHTGDAALWMPLPRSLDAMLAEKRGAHYLLVLGRLAPGATRTQAQAEMDGIARALTAAYPDTDTGRVARVAPLQEVLVRDVRPALWMLLGAVGFVLLIACANVANLLLARASARQRELAIRIALGAGRARLVRQMLVEALLLAVLGGALGTVLALWGLDALRGLIPDEVAHLRDIGIDGRVLGFTLLTAVVTGVMFGLVPALQAAAGNPGDALQEGARSTAHRARRRTRDILVAAEIAIALLLLVGAGLMLKSFHRLNQVDPGFDPRDLRAAALALSSTRYPDEAGQAEFYRRALASLANVPGAQVALAFPMPFTDGNSDLIFQVEGRPMPAPGHELDADFRSVSPGFFATLGIPLRRGRAFAAADDAARAEPVLLVNEAFAARFFPGQDPLGQRILIPFRASERPRRIVGVVGNVRQGALDAASRPEMYTPFGQFPFQFVDVVVRAAATTGLAATVRDRILAVDPDQPVGDLVSVAQAVHDSMARRRLATLLLAIFGGVALILAVVGVYGVMSYLVTQRTQEVGIRMALGARPRDVLALVVRHGLALTLLGIGVGLVGALALSRVLASQLYGVTPTDPTGYAAASLLLAAVAAAASWLPARRAARVDPMIALRAS